MENPSCNSGSLYCIDRESYIEIQQHCLMRRIEENCFKIRNKASSGLFYLKDADTEKGKELQYIITSNIKLCACTFRLLCQHAHTHNFYFLTPVTQTEKMLNNELVLVQHFSFLSNSWELFSYSAWHVYDTNFCATTYYWDVFPHNRYKIQPIQALFLGWVGRLDRGTEQIKW